MNERERKKAFSTNWFFEVILKNSKNYSRVVKTALLSTKKNQRVSCNYVFHILTISVVNSIEINLISV